MSTSMNNDAMEQENGVLPDQIILDEILTRLPMKFLCQFKSVSKFWNAVISSPQFAKAQLLHYKGPEFRFSVWSRSEPKWIFFQHGRKSCLLNYQAYDDDDIMTRYYNIYPGGLYSLGEVLDPDIDADEAHPFGSSYGLVCLLSWKEEKFCLFNPILGQSRIISSPVPFGLGQCPIGGFGYISSIDDFKLVFGFGIMRESDINLMYVFSLRHNNWRAIEVGDQFDLITCVPHKGVLVEERLHWWLEPSSDSTSEDSCIILAFDLVGEFLEQIPIPKELISKVPNMYNTSQSSGISVMEGCLCLSVVWKNSNNVEIWILKEYGEWDSWVRQYSICIPEDYVRYDFNCYEFYGITTTGKFIMKGTIIRDDYSQSEVIFIVGLKYSYPEFHPIWDDPDISYLETYVASLVSPFCFGNLVGAEEVKGHGVGDTREED